MSIPIISFYSYKGGAGRTTTTANSIKAIAQKLGANKNKPLLVIDMDLESAGLTYFFNLSDKFYSGTRKYPLPTIHTSRVLEKEGFIERTYNYTMIFEYESSDLVSIDDESVQMLNQISGELKLNIKVDFLLNFHIKKYTLSVLKDTLQSYIFDKVEFEKHGKFSFSDFIISMYQNRNNPIELNNTIESHLPTTTFSDISNFFDMEDGTVRFLGVDDTKAIALNANAAIPSLFNLKELCIEYDFCGIICDSSSGRQSTADVLHKASDILVYCMRPTNQFRKGTSNNLAYYKNLLNKKEGLRGSGTNRKIIILPTAVPAEPSIYTDRIFKEINDTLVSNNHFVNGYFCTHEKSLCEVEQFKWHETILKESSNMKKDEKRAYETFVELSHQINEMLNN